MKSDTRICLFINIDILNSLERKCANTSGLGTYSTIFVFNLGSEIVTDVANVANLVLNNKRNLWGHR